MECPNCKLENPNDAQRCDCGYDFLSAEMGKSYLGPFRESETFYLKIWSISMFWEILSLISLVILVPLFIDFTVNGAIAKKPSYLIFFIPVFLGYGLLLFVGYTPKKKRMRTYLSVYKDSLIFLNEVSEDKDRRYETKWSEISNIEIHKANLGRGVTEQRLFISYLNNCCDFGTESTNRNVPIYKKVMIPVDKLSSKKKILNYVKSQAAYYKINIEKTCS